jgi:hypothetical protein
MAAYFSQEYDYMTGRNPIFAIWLCTKFSFVMMRSAIMHLQLPASHVRPDQDPRRHCVSHRRLQGDPELTWHPPQRFLHVGKVAKGTITPQIFKKV